MNAPDRHNAIEEARIAALSDEGSPVAEHRWQTVPQSIAAFVGEWLTAWDDPDITGEERLVREIGHRTPFSLYWEDTPTHIPTDTQDIVDGVCNIRHRRIVLHESTGRLYQVVDVYRPGKARVRKVVASKDRLPPTDNAA